MTVTGILTQGLQTANEYCVEEFRVKTGLSETPLSYIQDNNGIGEQTFTVQCADTPNVPVMSQFHSRPRAQFVRIEPTKCYKSSKPDDDTKTLCVLRFEVLGCSGGGGGVG
ncbi:lactadherin-like [Amphiura filiformis]|uniref:lactadherin-like n=1 Tax=Amphiura filiformis TaxID=82378 RepID=UPI003B2268F7